MRQSIASNFRVLTGLFFLSGASSLILETIFSRLLTYTFGNTAQAVSAVLAAFLAGLALGAYVLGWWSDRAKTSPALYGALEIAIAAYALLIPRLFSLLTAEYVNICHRFALGPAGLTALRFGLAALVILPASFLMGATLPILSRYVASSQFDSAFQKRVDSLYGWNTLGAALGTLISTYFLIPSIRVSGTIYVACGMNVLIFVSTLFLSSAEINAPERTSSKSATTPSSHLAPHLPHAPGVVLAGAFLTGSAALGYEVVWTHIQAFTIGNTVYAFGVTLFVVLCGLGIGAHLVARVFAKPLLWARALAGTQFLVAVAVFGTLPVWGRLSPVFARGFREVFRLDVLGIATLGFAFLGWMRWRLYRSQAIGSASKDRLKIIVLLLAGLLAAGSLLILKNIDQIVLSTILDSHDTALFVAGELMRFLCAVFLLAIPAVLLGASFPLLINLYSARAEQAGSRVGRIYAANTAGAVLGAVLTGFFLISRLGSQGTLRALATSNAVLALIFALSLNPALVWRKALWVAATCGLIFAGWVGIGGWDPRLVCNGSYIYFAPSVKVDSVLYLKEDTAGGMTSVVESDGVRTLLSNGKFQGNDSTEQGAQVRFALLPMLFTPNPQSGLVIGLGTGQTLQTLSLFPFKRIDVAEMAPQIVEAASGWFTNVNGGVIDRDPRVHVSIADGRNFLLLSNRQYDAITVEVSSIWIDGEADLYNREFYELCRQHLTEDGILQQWVQVHHMPTKNLLVILNTLRSVFPYAGFFASHGPGLQGIILASDQPLTADYRRLRELDADPGVRGALDRIRTPTMESLLGDMYLYGDSMDQALAFLPRMGLPQNFTSTDFRPYLEYQTPKGNALSHTTIPGNLQFMRDLRGSSSVNGLTIRNVSSPDDWNLLTGYILAEQNETQAALEYFSRVNGIGRSQAQEQITRLQGAPASP
jgi:spermidine synthase